MVTKEMIKKEYIELRDTYLKIAVLFRQIQDKSTTKYKSRATKAEKPILSLAGVFRVLKNGATTTNMDMRVRSNK